MADRFSYRLLDQAQTLVQNFPQGSSGDTVVYNIFDIDDNTTDVTNTAMTNESGSLWSAAWTPSESHNFQIEYWHQTLDVRYYEYIKVVGTLVGVPGGAGTGTTLTNLRTRFLKLIDNYNANDLTGTNSSGEVADLCLNDALQLIYAQIKDSRYMQAYSSTGLASTANQSYIELSGITDVDNISSMKDTTNNITLKEIPTHQYFTQVPDAADQTGTPSQYCRIFNRIYLNPRPTAVITYTTEYVKTYTRLASDSDTALIPTKYDDWIYKEAREIYINDVMSNFDLVSVSRSHWNDSEPNAYPYDSPIGS